MQRFLLFNSIIWSLGLPDSLDEYESYNCYTYASFFSFWSVHAVTTIQLILRICLRIIFNPPATLFNLLTWSIQSLSSFVRSAIAKTSISLCNLFLSSIIFDEPGNVYNFSNRFLITFLFMTHSFRMHHRVLRFFLFSLINFCWRLFLYSLTLHFWL